MSHDSSKILSFTMNKFIKIEAVRFLPLEVLWLNCPQD